MSKIECSYVAFHNPVFHHGTNLGLKVDAQKRPGISLIRNGDSGFLEIFYNGKYKAVELSNVADWDPANAKEAGFTLIQPKVKSTKSNEVISNVAAPVKPVKAQVGGPAGILLDR